jgi:hypothetical protein
MLISGFASVLDIAVVVTFIVYRVFREGRPAPVEAITWLPKGARIVSVSVPDDRIVATVDVGGTLEVRTFDAKTAPHAPQERGRSIREGVCQTVEAGSLLVCSHSRAEQSTARLAWRDDPS